MSDFCGVGLQTSVAVYAADGFAELAYAAGGGVDGHALLEGFVPDADGTFLVRVDGWAATTGAYVIAVTSMLRTIDADCGCGDQMCMGTAMQPSQCVPKLSAPEGVGVGAEPEPLVLGQRMHGAIDVAFDVDAFAVTVGSGTYDLQTMSFCGTETDTHVAVYDGDTLLGEDDDSGEGFYGAVLGLKVSAATTLEVRVTGHGPSAGEYLVTVAPAVAPAPP